jgi:ATP-dependent DNA helicase PIF1
MTESKKGTKWSKEEDEQLISEMKNSMEISIIATNHGRTNTAIICRIYQHVYNMINNNEDTFDNIAKYVKMPFNDLKIGVENYEKKLKEKKELKDLKEAEKSLPLLIKKKEEDMSYTDIENKIKLLQENLNEKQKEALLSVLENNNIFLTGSPGTGKSFTLMRIVKLLNLKNKNYGITALTGCAAILINAQTVHSYLGLGIGTDTNDNIIKKLKTKQFAKYKMLCDLETLIIDEISMMDNNLFDKISDLLSKIKDNKKPFGGIQIILVGDFCQLSPINNDYCFMSSLWEASKLKTIELVELVRQKGDIEFQNILQEIRKGKCSKKTYNRLLELRNTKFENDIIPTKLFPINKNVDEINNKEFKKLCNNENGDIYHYKSTSYSKNIKSEQYDISLVKNAQVMITRNISIENGLINGTRGIVLSLTDKTVTIKDKNNNIHIIEYFSDMDNYSKLIIKFMPIKLAYAMSIHKSQGATIDAVIIDAGCDIFTCGQLYTALSRATSLSSIKILDLHPDSFMTNLKVKKFYNL